MPAIPLASQQSVSGTQPSTPHARRAQYLPASRLPKELLEHCKIYLEERLYVQALSLLQQSLVAGCSTSTPVQVPSRSIISLIATLAIHPSLTNANADAEKAEAANLAVHYLTHLNTIAGPVNARLYDAFTFSASRRGGGNRHTRSARRDSDRTTSHEEDSDSEDGVAGSLSTQASVWTCAQDFWHIVGWTMNCSVVHPARWTRWKVWLALMIKILEDDWQERWAILEDDQQTKMPSDDDFQNNLKDLLIHQFVGGAEATKQGGLNRMMRAIFAEASDKDLNEFGEIFPDETKVKEVKTDFQVDSKNINVEEGDFGNYFDEDEDEVTHAVTHVESRRRSAGKSEAASRNFAASHALKDPALQVIDAPEATLLRRRLLILLSKFAAKCDGKFTSHDILLDAYEQYMRPLSLARFVNLIAVTPPSPTNPCFGPATHVSLLQEIIRPLIAGSAPAVTDYYLTQDTLQSSYLPFAATQGSANNIVVDNAKVSLCLENMMRLLKANVGLTSAGGRLREAVERGVRERRARIDAAQERRRKSTALEAEAIQWLKSSETRLAMLVKMVEQQVP